MGSPIEEATCAVCLESSLPVRFLPCEHLAVCRQCLPLLSQPTCVLCRREVEEVDLDGQLYRWRSVVDECFKGDMVALQETYQVVLLGPGSVGTKAIVREICLRYRKTKGRDFRFSGAINGNRQQRFIHEESYVSGADWKNRFEHNSLVRGRKIRFSSCNVPRKPTTAEVNRICEMLAPDLVVLCCDYNKPSSFSDLLTWDSAIQRKLGVPTMWTVIVHANGDEGCKEVLNIAESVERARQTRDGLVRPAQHEVKQVSVDGWYTVGITGLVSSISRTLQLDLRHDAKKSTTALRKRLLSTSMISGS